MTINYPFHSLVIHFNNADAKALEGRFYFSVFGTKKGAIFVNFTPQPFLTPSLSDRVDFCEIDLTLPFISPCGTDAENWLAAPLPVAAALGFLEARD